MTLTTSTVYSDSYLTTDWLVGDKDYLNRQWQADLFDHTAMRLTTPIRKNQHGFAPFSPPAD